MVPEDDDPGAAGDDGGAADEPTASGSHDDTTDEPTTSGRAAGTAGEADDTPGQDEQYCSSCGAIIKREAEICPECGVRNRPFGDSAASGSKDRVTAGVLAILLGWFGAHKFYLGDTGLGILYLCFFWTGIPAIVGLIEGILYLTKTDEEFHRAYVE